MVSQPWQYPVLKFYDINLGTGEHVHKHLPYGSISSISTNSIRLFSPIICTNFVNNRFVYVEKSV